MESDSGLSDETRERITELSRDRIPLPENALHHGQLAECFERCWQRFVKVSPEHALVITWIAQDGMTHEQVAELLGRTPGATREFISQCRKRARVHLAEWYEQAFGKG
jgi:RNA polymerase sigma-70 factor (ECF subfamily)